MSTRPGRNQRGEDRNEHEAMVQRREECGVLRLPAPFGLTFRSCPPDGITIKRANFFLDLRVTGAPSKGPRTTPQTLSPQSSGLHARIYEGELELRFPSPLWHTQETHHRRRQST